MLFMLTPVFHAEKIIIVYYCYNNNILVLIFGLSTVLGVDDSMCLIGVCLHNTILNYSACVSVDSYLSLL